MIPIGTWVWKKCNHDSVVKVDEHLDDLTFLYKWEGFVNYKPCVYLYEDYESVENTITPKVTDTVLIKNLKPIRKLSVMFIDHHTEPCLCDCCDETKQCAHIVDVIGKNISIVCKDCLQQMSNLFNNTTEDE